MNPSQASVIITTTDGNALTELCGISMLDRLLRILQRLGVGEAAIVTTDVRLIAEHLAKRAWARSEIGVTICASCESPPAARTLVIAAAYHDSRLLGALLEQTRTTVLVDSAPPSAMQPLLEPAAHDQLGYFCGAAMVEAEWLTRAADLQDLFDRLGATAGRGEVALLDVDRQPAYVVALRRVIRPLWFPTPKPEQVARAERLILDSAQNGTLDLPAKLHGPIETWIIARLCRTAITPMRITLFTAAVSVVVTLLFASGQLVAGTLLALAVGILDGLDGKQARVKVETTQLGKREHVLDYVLELSWWMALAFHFTASAQVQNAYAFLALLAGSDVVDRLAKKQAKHVTGRNLDDVAPIDRFVRLIGGRRNIYIWIFAAGLVFGAPDKAFIALCCWGALTAAVHSLRALSLNRQLRGARSKGAAH